MPKIHSSKLMVVLAVGSLLLTASCGSSSPSVVPSLPWPSSEPQANTPDTESPGTSGSTAVGGCEPIASPSGVRKEMFDTLNMYRIQNGLAALAYSSKLQAVANAHAKDMYNRDYFDHTNPDGDGPLERVEQAGFCDLRWVGENIAMGQRTVQEVHTAWMNSPEHNYVMLHHQPNFVGMGYYVSPAGVPYWVQDYARSGS